MMREVTLQELKNMARAAYNDLWTAARNMGRDVKLYCHWTGGDYYTKFSDYHVNIDGDGRVWVTTDNLAMIKISIHTLTQRVTMHCYPLRMFQIKICFPG